MPPVTEHEVSFKATDGWGIRGSLHVPSIKTNVPGVLLLHGFRHERDAYGDMSSPGLLQMLNHQGVATLRIDTRGRGASREPLEYHTMTPEQRSAVRLDVESGIKFLASQPGVNANRIGVIGEQDSAGPALAAIAKNRQVRACALISGRLDRFGARGVPKLSIPVLCIVNKEDRRGFQDMRDLYLASRNRNSRFKVYEDMPLGTTMFSAWRYEYPDEKPIEDLIVAWMAAQLVRPDRWRKAGGIPPEQKGKAAG